MWFSFSLNPLTRLISVSSQNLAERGRRHMVCIRSDGLPSRCLGSSFRHCGRFCNCAKTSARTAPAMNSVQNTVSSQ